MKMALQLNDDDTTACNGTQLVPVKVCGQELEASWTLSEGPPSLEALSKLVEQGIGIQQDWIQLYDRNGNKLLTNEEVSRAITDGLTPIYGAISDHSVHNFEQRENEFAHMQWKVMRDQFAVLSLQVAHTQQQLKNLQEDIPAKDAEQVRRIDLLANKMTDGINVVQSCQSSCTRTEELVDKLTDNVQRVMLKIDEETAKRDSIMQEVEFKIERMNSSNQNETNRLTEAFDSCVNLLQEADKQISQDVHALEFKIQAARDLANSHHEEAMKIFAEARTLTTRAISDAGSSLLKEAQEDAEKRVHELANTIAKFETRIVKSECLASDTANRWLTSNEQLKGQYNSLLQGIEQCRLQSRVNQASIQEVRDKVELHKETIQKETMVLKDSQECERRDRQEQIKSMQQSFDGILKSTLGELESRLVSRVDREADARRESIVQVLDDIGAAIEQDIPCNVVRSSVSRQQSVQKVQAPRQGYMSPISPMLSVRSVPHPPSLPTAATPGFPPNCTNTPRETMKSVAALQSKYGGTEVVMKAYPANQMSNANFSPRGQFHPPVYVPGTPPAYNLGGHQR